jgi:hypothetical protein
MNAQMSPNKPGKIGRLWKMLPALSLLVALIACNMPLGGPQAPTPRPAPANNSDTGQTTDWRTQIENAQPGDQITATLTEADLTEILADAARNNPDVNIQEPRVVLQNGIMQVYGKASMDVVTANFRVDMNVKVNDQGKPEVDVISADFGGIPVPDSMRETLTQGLNSSLEGAIGPSSSRFRAEQITITDGLMTINGTVQ